MEHSIAVKDAQSDVHSESATVKFKDSIKVSFRVNSIQNIFRGKEGRVPVEHCLFFKVSYYFLAPHFQIRCPINLW